VGDAAAVRRRVVVPALAAVLVAAVWYGQAPPRSVGAYRQRAVETAEFLRSQAAAGELWVRAVSDGRVTHQAATVAFEELETDANSTEARFAGWDPPPGSTDLRTRVTGLGGTVSDRLADLRIASHADRWADLPALAAALASAAEPLDALLADLAGGGA
jgi:hypothetical protein